MTYFDIDGDILKRVWSSDIEVVIPDGIRVIGINSFNKNGIIQSVVLPNSVEIIDSFAFAEMQDLQSIKFGNNVKIIKDYAFYFCKNLELDSLPDSISKIDINAFYSCYNITISKLPDSLIEICSGAFTDCYDITSISISSNNNLKLMNNVFENCRKLKSISINVDDVDIYTSAFSSCCNLEFVSIIANRVCLSDYLFYDCNRLETVIINGNLDEAMDDTFAMCYIKNLSIKSVPTASIGTSDFLRSFNEYSNWFKYYSDLNVLNINGIEFEIRINKDVQNIIEFIKFLEEYKRRGDSVIEMYKDCKKLSKVLKVIGLIKNIEIANKLLNELFYYKSFVTREDYYDLIECFNENGYYELQIIVTEEVHKRFEDDSTTKFFL